jgi:hypothetical protein
MRIFAIPAALMIACFIYLPLPKAAQYFERALRALYAQTLRLFTKKDGSADHQPALAMYLLLLCGVCVFLGAIHPLASMILMIPLFTGLSVIPDCANTEHELDSGKYANDIPAYEAIVRESCSSVAPEFVGGVIAPMLLCGISMPLHMAAPVGSAYAALCALAAEDEAILTSTNQIQRITEKIFIFFMTLCSGVKGRNPLNIRGKTAETRLLNIVGIAGDSTDTHAPMAGDIAQAIFLCFFSTVIFCFTLCAVGFVLCF